MMRQLKTKKLYVTRSIVAGVLLGIITTIFTQETSMHISHVIIPAAGMGTRFLPFTKSVPKEMLPILNLPAIHYIIEEGIGSGIADFFIVANNDKQALFDYLSDNPLLNKHLGLYNKQHLLNPLNSMINKINVIPVAQPEPLGLGHAILMAQTAVGDNYFGIILPDDIFISPVPALSQLISIAQKEKVSVIAVQKVPREKISSYGVIAIKEQVSETLFEISCVVEKPHADQAPSDFAISGRYVFCPALFNALSITQPSVGGEIQLTDGINHLIAQGHKVLAYVVDAERFDVGNPHGWLYANMAFALQNPAFAKDIASIKNLLP